MKLKDFTYNTPTGEVTTQENIVTTSYWANGCKPSQKGYDPTFEEVGQTITMNTPFTNWMVDIHVKGVDNSGYLVGRITKVWKKESFHPDNFQ